MILFILQNGYHSDRYQYRNLEEWSCDLARSHTGRRLLSYIPEGVEYRVINATPIVGADVNSCIVPDLNYIKGWLQKLSPTIICACGKVAQAACKDLGIEFIAAPHPAWRALSKSHCRTIQQTILHYAL